MAKKSKLLSWLGFGKSDKKQQAEQSAQEADNQQQARLAAEKAEAEHLEQQRLAAEKAEQEAAEKIAAEQVQKEQAEKLAIEKANAELLAKQQADAHALQLEQQQRLAEQEAQMRLEQEKAAAEQAEAENLEQQKLAVEQAQREQAEKLAIEKANAELLAKQQADAHALQLEQQQRLAEQAEKLAIEKANAELLVKQQADAHALKLEQQQRLAEQEAQMRLEQEKAAAEKAEAERLEQVRIAAEQAEAERLEQARIAAEQAEAERLEQARIAAERAEAEQLEQQRIADEQAEALEQQRIAAEQAEAERLEQQRIADELASEAAQKVEKPKKEGFFSRLKKGLLKTRVNIGSGFASIFSGKKIDDDLFEELETQLLTADLGVDTTMKLIDRLTDAANRKQLKDGDALYELMKQEMAVMLKTAEQPLVIPADKKPFVILMVGVNGVGKTTTIGKLAKQFQSEGKSVMLAAGDTFRAAAVEQLQVWGERNSIPVIAQHTGADSASVIFDAFQAAKARNVDVLIADTAGRLQNKDNLMQELEKIARVMKKIDPDAPHEVMLTIDAGTGQNAISQVNLFNQCVGLTGITLSKLDGTAKGGVIFAVADKFNIPIRYIGVGESIDDLRAFKSDDFIDALFSQDEDDA
ncbi:signal recognition particle-docking protein FtsY [Pseudoalteromonas sp. JB197]|uniref:signal recognition particle-docking protein FtsY n=1 Tax=Pseudoalteromonas sp. JB197 TaxID=1434839 RepID=UPI00097F3BD3|nr:signal recognition particle-docking protein FtsY [Pseudoalteromonas sp. JB197]PCC13801.1 signal recognition particle-docking protein FtsY [Pseudoalteromonas sp. JB197]SJN42623.1 Signal recognition particle receptor protein FtsY (=alpha subunit) (TC 3.A.5.1.1) [Pseudoalteromonas sp. JB197]